MQGPVCIIYMWIFHLIVAEVISISTGQVKFTVISKDLKIITTKTTNLCSIFLDTT